MFKLAVIGRPNVGKSSLFNSLSGKKLAITSELSGLSRDRKEAIINFHDMVFKLFDTGGYDDLNNILNQKIWEQASVAIEESNAVLFVLDGKFGLSPLDKHLADMLRKIKKPVIVVVNKFDTREGQQNLPMFFELGFSAVIPISAVHKIGFGDLYEVIHPIYLEYRALNPDIEKLDKPEMVISFIGKPNVGKSTIINNLLGENRLITHNQSGTTRDSVYLDFHYKDKKFKIVDTAGLRRKSKIEDTSVERMSTVDTIRAINFATVAILVLSAEDGLTKQDLKIAKLVVEEGRGLIIIINKIDLINKKQEFLNSIAQQIESAFFQIKKPYVLGVSAIKDKNLSMVLDIALDLYEKWQFKISTARLNKWLSEVIAKNEPPSVNGRRVKVKYISQGKSRPPTLNVWSNQKEKFPVSYLRYLQNEFFSSFNLWGCTVRFNVKKSDNPYHDKDSQ